MVQCSNERLRSACYATLRIYLGAIVPLHRLALYRQVIVSCPFPAVAGLLIHCMKEGTFFAAPINVVPVEIHVWCVRDAVFPPSPSVRSSALPPLSDLSGAWDDGSVEGGLFRRRVVSILPSLLEVEADSLVEKIDVSVDFFIWVWFFVLAVDTRRD